MRCNSLHNPASIFLGMRRELGAESVPIKNLGLPLVATSSNTFGDFGVFKIGKQ